MPAFTLARVAILPAGAFGVLFHELVPFAVTLEHTYESLGMKVPEGSYDCERTLFHRGGYPTYEIPVPGHTRILFHRGNVEDDVDGCVAVAKSWGVFGGKPGVASSRQGFSEFMALCEDADTISVTITNVGIDRFHDDPLEGLEGL